MTVPEIKDWRCPVDGCGHIVSSRVFLDDFVETHTAASTYAECTSCWADNLRGHLLSHDVFDLTSTIERLKRSR